MFADMVHVPILINGTDFVIAEAELTMDLRVITYLSSIDLNKGDMCFTNGEWYRELEEANSQEDFFKSEYNRLIDADVDISEFQAKKHIWFKKGEPVILKYSPLDA